MRSLEGLTDLVDITEGVLQGDNLSAIIFALYTRDFEESFGNGRREVFELIVKWKPYV